MESEIRPSRPSALELMGFVGVLVFAKAAEAVVDGATHLSLHLNGQEHHYCQDVDGYRAVGRGKCDCDKYV